MVAHDLGEVVELVRARQTEGRLVVGVAGEPGAGKSTIAALLVAALGPDAALLPMDGYHLPQTRLRELGRRERMGAPDTFDVPGFVTTLGAIRAQPFRNADFFRSADSFRDDGDPVLARGFDRATEEPVADAIVISPSFRNIVVEGNYLLLDSGGWEQVRPLLDLTFFVDVEPGIRQQRLIERHVRFGKSLADATAWALGPDESNARLIRATAMRADHVIRIG